MSKNAKKIVVALLTKADIKINGDRPWDITVNNEKLYSRILSQGSLGFGESYMDAWWDCEQLDVMISKVFQMKLHKEILKNWSVVWNFIKARAFNQQTKKRSFIVGEKHYDVGNDLYEKMLDKRLVYSCGYWKTAQDLDEAQEHKLDLICKKLHLKEGMRVLDIGCGWGGFAKYAAEKYGVEVVGLTISKEQANLAKEKVKGLPVDIRLQDYRRLDERFDRILSIGMFEHVGYKNYRAFMKVVSRNLNESGLQLLHTIGSNISVCSTDPWIEKYIFPNSMLPSVKQIAKASEKIFILEDWHNFGTYYDKTLMEWYKNFINNWPILKNKYNERFKRMWIFYLLTSAGSFRARRIQLWQIVFSKNGVPGVYKSIR